MALAMKPVEQDAQSGPAIDRRSITILGSTGSVGRSTIDLIRRNRELFSVEALVAGRNIEKLAGQAIELCAKLAVVADESRYEDLRAALDGSGIEAAAGQAAVVEAAARPADWLMSAIVGAAGLEPTFAAVRRGAVIGLANKETLVCAGDLMVEEVERHGATLLPVDSEHNAIFQTLERDNRDSVEKIILTASGGPFRTNTVEEMRTVTPEQAVAHPNWSMGVKISVDSATMMNKGLELIEASYLFDMPGDRIEVLVHPQSIVHSMVGYRDGSVLAQLGAPDMRTPIAHTLAWPARMETPCERLDLAKVATLTFERPDPNRFPALRLARQALDRGRGAPIVLNAANEIAVEAFLERRIAFLEIARIVEQALDRLDPGPISSLDQVWAADAEARRLSTSLVGA